MITNITPFGIVLSLFTVVAALASATAHRTDEDYDHSYADHDYHDGHHLSRSPIRRTQTLNQTTTTNVVQCGTHSPTLEEMDATARVVDEWMSNVTLREQKRAATIYVPTYFHVVLPNENVKLEDNVLRDQLDVLNEAFEPYGFTFELEKIDRTYNNDWYTASQNDADELAMKKKLRLGFSNALNVYFNTAGDNLLGHATFPNWYAGSPTTDGVVLDQQALPGGSVTTKNLGRVLVHEVGHWLGLIHTFETYQCCPDTCGSRFRFIRFICRSRRRRNLCQNNNDYVDDTPTQAFPTSGCPTSSNTCPEQSGNDPIHNYMDYSDDVCRTEFTTGQKDRMQAMWYKYRAFQEVL